MRKKAQLKYNIKNNNAILNITAKEDQVRNIYNFCHNYSDYSCRFHNICNQIAPQSQLSQLKEIDCVEELDVLIGDINK